MQYSTVQYSTVQRRTQDHPAAPPRSVALYLSCQSNLPRGTRHIQGTPTWSHHSIMRHSMVIQKMLLQTPLKHSLFCHINVTARKYCSQDLYNKTTKHHHICLQSRPVDPDVVCQLVSQSVSNVDQMTQKTRMTPITRMPSDWMTRRALQSLLEL